VLVFTRTKHGANKLSQQLERDGITSAAIHGNKSQGARTRALADFKAGAVRVLVATDIAARGLDIEQLPHVVNYELPNVPEDYVHRIGRTGRAGASGEAISLVSPEERKLQLDIEKLLKRKLDMQPVPYFEPGEKKPMQALDELPRRNPKAARSARSSHSTSAPKKNNSDVPRKSQQNRNRPQRSRDADANRSNADRSKRSGANQNNSNRKDAGAGAARAKPSGDRPTNKNAPSRRPGLSNKPR
jgi:ATP-dependent RNA helicase RhlE